jgi:hypothetical protein
MIAFVVFVNFVALASASRSRGERLQFLGLKTVMFEGDW